MSFCPTKDIHSVYLDNELPENYKAEYELHLSSCPKCQKELEALKTLRAIIKTDSDAITPDAHYLDQSFERLQIKMAYSKNIGKIKKTNSVQWKYVASAAAAAAVFALVVPLRINSLSKNNNSISSGTVAYTSAYPASVATGAVTSANNVSFDSGRNVLVSGNIQETVLSSEKQKKAQAPLAKNVKEVEVFRPELEDETISIKITVPGVGEIPVTTEINVPLGVVAGRF